MTQYTFNLGTAPLTLVGSLGWNANGTLTSLGITDQIHSANSQTCSYGYDDLQRNATFNCGSSIQQQNFSYDVFGNINKTVPTGGTGTSYQPTYSSSTNRMTALPGFTPTYDANGNVLTDSVNTYTWAGCSNQTHPPFVRSRV